MTSTLTVSPYTLKYGALPSLFSKMSPKERWQLRKEAIEQLEAWAQSHPAHVAACLPEIIPMLSKAAGDARKEIAAAAEKALTCVCACMNNKDLEPFIPVLVSCLARPDELPECVHKLSATTFVQAIERPTLAVLVPILERGLRERTARTRRSSAIICDNMCKLVEHPAYAAPLLPTLHPLLDSARKETADPEVREVCDRAYKTLSKAAQGAKLTVGLTTEEIRKSLEALHTDLVDHPNLESLSHTIAFALDMKELDKSVWHAEVVKPYLEEGLPLASDLCDTIYNHFVGEVAKAEEEEEDTNADLCKCNFSLAYGGKILLNQATLHLKKGHRYGLCGPNGCGKSTLLRAIGNEQVDGFPKRDEVKTAFVEHDLDGSLSDLNVVNYLVTSLSKEGLEISEDDARCQLEEMGFTREKQAAAISSLSGGWKMKLALSRAILQNPDILLLDEPTNHLDVANVAWLVAYLNKPSKVSSIIVSHDSAFLDAVCTDILHYNSFKLHRYRGNLSAFVKLYPEAAAYYSLTESALTFSLPEPGFLEGVSTKGKAILKATGLNFTYPGTATPIVQNASVVCSLSSRVGCIGPNGAGKSTLIKLLTGELTPDSGSVWKHPSVRIAYVAQHAFHHIEEHLDKTPSEYIQWRFASGDDKEAEDKVALKATDEEEKKMSAAVQLDGAKFVVEQVLNRRKFKSTFEYETSFVGQSPDKNKWLPRRWLEDAGFGKLVNQVDAREAAAAGLHQVPLTSANIAKHLDQVGLEQEFTLHNRMRGLSGGQKVKVVLGAACWMRPHLIVLDEPTNYLDRDSLGALAAALKNFGGGVVIISHAGEFIDATTTERWIVGGGQLQIEGETWNLASAKLTKGEQADETVDAAGNVVKIAKQLTEQEKKRAEKEKLKRRKEKEKRRKRGEVVSSDSEDE